MFAVIYRFKLKPDQEIDYKECWQKVAQYFRNNCGALGSCLHKGENGLWVAYSRWPSKETRDAAWPGESEASQNLPLDVRAAISKCKSSKNKMTIWSNMRKFVLM